jgi:tRNA(fMet)-specific endonuclease VapC
VFCLDTNVVIFANNERRPKIVERLHRELAAGTPMIVPALVMFELEYGCAKSKRREQSRRALEIFLSAGPSSLSSTRSPDYPPRTSTS